MDLKDLKKPLDLSTCQNFLTNCTANLTTCLNEEKSRLFDNPACDGVSEGEYDLALHIGSVFIILAVSIIGSVIPILGRLVSKRLAFDPYVVAVGKAVGTGIVLGCALIHMLQPAAEALTSACVPIAFNTDYQAYAFMFCMIAALFMHTLESFIGFWSRKLKPAANPDAVDDADKLEQGRNSSSSPAGHGTTNNNPIVYENDGTITNDDTILDNNNNNNSPSSTSIPAPPSIPPPPPTVQQTSTTNNNPQQRSSSSLSGGHHHHHHHIHGPIPLRDEHLIQTYSMEFALTVHSIFIGMTIGIVRAEELISLLVALCFHQFFEGVALGARLADLPDSSLTVRQMVILVMIFSLSAPIGIIIGIIATSNVSENGVAYLLTQGIFDGLCAGILLYVGFQLLLHDFPNDSERLCSDKPREAARRIGMFVGLWSGAGFMAIIGKFL
jgi:zinc transporter 1/2/3